MNLGRLRALVFVVAVAGLLGWKLVRRGQASPLIGQHAPDFSLSVGAGEGADQNDRVRLSDLQGQVVVLDFWASWCGPCRASVPILSRLSKRYAGQGVHFLGVNSESFEPRALATIWRDWGFAYPTLRDGALTSHRDYAVELFPTILVIDRTQQVRFAHVGVPSETELSTQIASILE